MRMMMCIHTVFKSIQRTTFKRHSTVGWNFEPTGKNQISFFCPYFNYLKCFESPIKIIGHPDQNCGLQSDFKKIGPKPMVIGVILGVRQFQCQSSRNLSRCQVMIKFEKFRYFWLLNGEKLGSGGQKWPFLGQNHPNFNLVSIVRTAPGTMFGGIFN